MQLHSELSVTMEKVIYGNFYSEGLELIERNEKYYVRYDAGAHQEALREDELSKDEAMKLQRGKKEEYEVIIAMQARLKASGKNPHEQNWYPANGNT